MLTKDDIAALRSAAQKATPGPWTTECREEESPGAPSVWAVLGDDTSYEATLCELWSGEHDNAANAAYIASLSPERILALCDAADALRDIVQFCDDPNGSQRGETLAAGMARLLPRARAIVGDKG